MDANDTGTEDRDASLECLETARTGREQHISIERGQILVNRGSVVGEQGRGRTLSVSSTVGTNIRWARGKPQDIRAGRFRDDPAGMVWVLVIWVPEELCSAPEHPKTQTHCLAAPWPEHPQVLPTGSRYVAVIASPARPLRGLRTAYIRC